MNVDHRAATVGRQDRRKRLCHAQRPKYIGIKGLSDVVEAAGQ